MRRSIEHLVLVLVMALIGCSGATDSGPGEVRWDKDVCARCLMSVSDRMYSAQVRGGPEGQRTKLYFFDDFGCAVLWLDTQAWREDPRTMIWVNDELTGDWLNARTAFFQTGRITPMDYGLGAGLVAMPGALDFSQAVDEVHDRENGQHRRPGSAETQSKGTP
jgi:hypothetical protein